MANTTHLSLEYIPSIQVLLVLTRLRLTLVPTIALNIHLATVPSISSQKLLLLLVLQLILLKLFVSHCHHDTIDVF